MLRFLWFCCLLGSSGLIGAQDASIPREQAILVHVSYGAHLSQGDLSERFGLSLSPELSVEWLNDQNTVLAGLQGAFFFGNQVEEDVLAPLRTRDGGIIGNDRSFADLLLRQRGFFLGAHLGKIFTFGQQTARSGLRISVGGGFFQHRIRIQEDPSRNVPQLDPPYRAGYDRLTNGPALRQAIGFQMLSADGRINVKVTLVALQAFTQNRRPFNFDTRTADRTRRLDAQFGIRASWTLPFYLQDGSGIFY